MSRVPIRWRLALAFAIAMAVVLEALGAFVYVRLENSLTDGLDETLELRAAQTGSPIDVYRKPLDEWVAGFVGDAVLVRGLARGAAAETSLGPVTLLDIPLPANGQTPVIALIRPEQVLLGPRDRAPSTAAPATVTRRVFHGHDELIMLRLADGTEALSRALDGTTPVEVGDRCAVWVRGPVRAWHRVPEPSS